MQETPFLFLGWEDPLEEGVATHSSIFAWRIPIDRGVWWATVHAVTESDTTEWLSTAQHMLFTTSALQVFQRNREGFQKDIGGKIS